MASNFMTVELLYRDEFGVHQRGDSVPAATWPRLAAAVRSALLRPRRFSPEVALWAVIGILLVLFAVVLITGETAVARSGR